MSVRSVRDVLFCCTTQVDVTVLVEGTGSAIRYSEGLRRYSAIYINTPRSISVYLFLLCRFCS